MRDLRSQARNDRIFNEKQYYNLIVVIALLFITKKKSVRHEKIDACAKMIHRDAYLNGIGHMKRAHEQKRANEKKMRENNHGTSVL